MPDAKLVITNIRGLKSAWLEDGDSEKPILLMLHGFPDDPTIWDPQVQFFKDHFHVVRPYNRGVYPTDSGKTSRYGTDAIALDLMEILDNVDPSGERPVILMGHDLGAAMAWALAPFLGKRLKAMAIVNGLSITQMVRRFGDLQQQRKSWYMYFMQLPLAPEALLGTFTRRFRRMAYEAGGLPAENRVEEADDDVATKYSIRNSINHYRAFTREIPKQLLRGETRLPCPLLVLWGNEDKFLVPPTLQELELYAQNVKVRIFQGNHWVFRTHAPEVNDALSQFFQKETHV